MKRLVAIVIPILLIAGLIGGRIYLKRTDKQAQDQAAAQRKNTPPNVNVAPAVRRDILHTYEAVGGVESPFNVRISPRITGRITMLTLRQGDPVTAGQIVARIDPSEIEAQVRQQEAALAEAQQRLTQAQITTGSTNTAVTTQIQQQKAAVSSASANYNQVKQNYAAQVAAAQSAVTDAQSRVDSASSAIENAQAALHSALTTQENYQTRYDRTNSLYKQGFIAAQDVDDARTQLHVQQSAVEVARGQLDAAKSAKKSSQAQLSSAKEQASIVITKGKADIEASLAAKRQAQAALELAKANTSQKSAYQANLAALRSAVDIAEAQLKNARANLNETDLRSSISGFVTDRSMDPGSVVTAGQTILAIQSLREVYVTTSIPEDIRRFVNVGGTAEAFFDAIPNKSFHGKITQVNQAADVQSRQFSVRITLDNPAGQIKPGMFARVQFVTERIANAIVVPREAVQAGPKGTTVRVLDSQEIAHIRPVKTGAQDTLGIAILDGIQPGDRVITLSMTPVKEGQKVKVGSSS